MNTDELGFLVSLASQMDGKICSTDGGDPHTLIFIAVEQRRLPLLYRVLWSACLVDETPTVGWIPCSERMPEKSGTYLASTDMGDVGLAECDWDYEDGMYWSAEYLDVDAIVAWMELPEPYREDKG